MRSPTSLRRLDDSSFHWKSIQAEMSSADARYGGFNSTHEGYGVLCEEVAELLDAIRANDLGAVRREAIQVAAVAARLALACEQPATAERSRK